jgi:hypothetical protein
LSCAEKVALDSDQGHGPAELITLWRNRQGTGLYIICHVEFSQRKAAIETKRYISRLDV